MRITVFGGTGGTGRLFVDNALSAGHDVTALVRDVSRLRLSDDRVHSVPGDVLDPVVVKSAVAGADAVVSALGVTNGRVPTTLYSAGMRNIVEAMNSAHVRRVLAISALPLTPRKHVGFVQRRVAYPFLYKLFGEGYADMGRMERLLRDESELDWTVVRPPRLTNGSVTDRCRMAINEPLRGASKIARADLAVALLHMIDDLRTVRAVVTVAR